MTLTEVLAWSMVRAVVLAFVALPLSFVTFRTVEQEGSWWRLPLLMALLPLFVPDLLVGFSYRMTAMRLVHSGMATETLYALLLLCRIVALQIVVRMLLPTGTVSSEAIHSWKMLHKRGCRWWWNGLRLQLSGPKRCAVVAWLGSVMWCFQEFETAALMQIEQYPIAFNVWLFDAHAAGEPLNRSLEFVTPAVLLQSCVLIPFLWMVSRGPAVEWHRSVPAAPERIGHSKLAPSSPCAVSYSCVCGHCCLMPNHSSSAFSH